jgi:cell fate (sporulation/competence/biofilm development) regulator YmcA (YheA/YmcA/DUF963 family)
MHDTTDFAPTDYSLYEPRVSTNDPLVEHQTFKLKEYFLFAIFTWHIEKNREYMVTDSSTQKLRVKCKDPIVNDSCMQKQSIIHWLLVSFLCVDTVMPFKNIKIYIFI